VVEAGPLLDANEELDLAMIKRRSRDDDLLRPALVDVGTSLLGIGVVAGRFDHDVGAEVSPGQLGRVRRGDDLTPEDWSI
jgi:hypothetical protein